MAFRLMAFRLMAARFCFYATTWISVDRHYVWDMRLAPGTSLLDVDGNYCLGREG